MTQAVKDLIETAKALEIYETDDELKSAVSALEALGDEAKGSTNEYKKLKELIDQTDGKISEEAKAEKINVFGIKMIGGKHYHESDNYSNGFDTVEECAMHYNG